MSNLSKEELLKLYNEMSVETLQKLGIYEQAQAAYNEKQEEERLKQQRLEQAKALVEQAMELLDRYRLELRVSAARGIRFVDRDGRTVQGGSQRKRGSGSRVQRGVKTPGSQYRIPILQAVVELGGSAKKRMVMESVYEKMKDELVPEDLEELPAGGIRWHNRASWKYAQMKREEGLFKENVPKGIWEISDKGRQYLQEHW